MVKNVFLDTETCGLHGQAVLIQYAYDNGPIILYEPWKEPIHKTLQLIEDFMSNNIIGFNLAFDMFVLAKMYTIFRLCPKDWIPEEHINEIAFKEPEGMDGPCIKPVAACDLLLHSRRGPYQSLMAREDIRIRRVPTALAYALAQELEQRIEIDGIYFARSADKDAPRWKVYDIVSKRGIVNPDFKDVVLKFHAAGGLKFLAEYVLKMPPKYHFADVELDSSWRPYELGYAPTALAVAQAPDWECYDTEGKLIGMAWPSLIHEHIRHWSENEQAREYANDDVLYTRLLWKHFGEPTPGDTDSELACMVATVRWHGFTIDGEGIEELLQHAVAIVAQSPVNINKPPAVRRYLVECMDDTESLIIEESTKKQNIEQVGTWTVDTEEICTKCDGTGHFNGNLCVRCNGTGKLFVGAHPAAIRAAELLSIKESAKEVELYTKLLKAGRLHASFKVIGTLSSRMSGGDGLNAQGIKHAKNVRKMFPLSWDGMVLCGGDFDAFEVTIADAVFDDPALRSTLVTPITCAKCNGTGIFELTTCPKCNGTGKVATKIHALLGVELYTDKTYQEIVDSDGAVAPAIDFYTRSKQGMFGFLYGGDYTTWNKRLNIPAEQARHAYDKWCAKYPGIGKSRLRIQDDFCSMRQLDTKQVIWHEPKDYVETFLGFKRYFTLENRICKALFELAHNPPAAWRNCHVQVVRRERFQTASGAVQSAVFGAAFQIQAANMRAANNHLIQSAGAQITKETQRKIWDLQPSGVNEWRVAPMNIHDEIMCITRPDSVDNVAECVRGAVESFRPQVPLIGIKWSLAMDSWAEKKAGASMLHVTYKRAA
jgi:hypothetical protein